MENNSNKGLVHVVSNDDFFYLLFKTFVQQLKQECILRKVEFVHDVYNAETTNNGILPDLIIIDANIERISPIDLVNVLRSVLHYKMPIWFVSEIVAAQYVSKIMDVGANRMISKPFDPELLAQEIVMLINNKLMIEDVEF